MTSKQNLTLHMDGVNACEEKEYEHALALFRRITEPSAQIFFNMGNCYLQLGYPREALQMFEECVGKDKYLAIGFFQLAIAQALCNDYTTGITNFQAAFKALRGNPFIDYKQLNMSRKLYACEINFNLGLLYLFSGDPDGARNYFETASGSPADNTRHGCISEAMSYVQRGDWNYFGQSPNHRLIHLPEQSFFRVSKAKMEGLQGSTKFMDSAKVVSASKEEYSFVGFVGAKKNPPNPNNAAAAKRPSPPSGPPPPMPSIPPPRLPPSVSPPRRRSPSPTPARSSKSPVRLPPSRPPPPTVVAPTPSSPSNNKVNANLEKSKAPPSDVSKIVECELEFNVNLKNDLDYAEMLKVLSKKLAGMASDLENSLQRKSMILTVQDVAKKSTTAVAKSSDWESTWSSLTKNRFSKARIKLRDLSGEAQGKFPYSPSHNPRPVSPAMKPSRPAPTTPLMSDSDFYRNASGNNQQDDGIYHDIS